MDHSRPIATQSLLGLDKRVWLAMAALILVSLGLLSYKMIETPACIPFGIQSAGVAAGAPGQYFSGRAVDFTVDAPGSKSVAWDFGDRSPGVTGVSAHHVFIEPGTYQVKATINGRCMAESDITIRQPEAPTASAVQEENDIIGPDVQEAGKPVQYRSSTKAAAYEWSVQGDPSFRVQKGETAVCSFKSPGIRVLLLKLHSPDKISRKTINIVASAAQAPAVPQPQAIPLQAGQGRQKKTNAEPGTAFPTIDGPVEVESNSHAPEAKSKEESNGSDPDFVRVLNKAVEGKEDMKGINALLCRGGATKVLANGSEWDTMSGFYEKIKGNKAYSITGVKVVRDDQNCISVLKVSFKKRKFGLF